MAYNTEKMKNLLNSYKMLDRDDAAEIIEAMNAIDEPVTTDEDRIASINREWSEKFKKAFFSGTIENPGEGAPSEPLPETAPEPEILENSKKYSYDALFTDAEKE